MSRLQSLYSTQSLCAELDAVGVRHAAAAVAAAVKHLKPALRCHKGPPLCAVLSSYVVLSLYVLLSL